MALGNVSHFHFAVRILSDFVDRLAFTDKSHIDGKEKETAALLPLFGMFMADKADLGRYPLPLDSINRNSV